MALHAMSNGDEIEPAFHLVAEIGLGHGFLGARKHLVRDLHLVDGIPHPIADRLERAQIGDDAIEIAGSEDLVEAGGHDLSQMVARGPYALQQCRLKSASLHLPRPVSGSGVRLDPVTSNGGSLKRRPPDSALSNCGPFGPIGVWQLWQVITVLTR